MIGEDFRPLGARAFGQTKISRRHFLGTGMAAPVAVYLDTKTQWAAPARSDDLRFIRNAEGVSVIDPSDAVWRLRGVAFGPSTIFKLRTLRDGSEKGYEIEIGGVRFGSQKGRKHWIVFQRSGKIWRVRMRSNLWSADDGEITSSDVLFSALTTAPKNKGPCVPPTSWFLFRRPAKYIAKALTKVLDGHLRASGTLQLEFDADAVWRFTPQGSGRLTVAPFGFALSSLAIAWCDTVTDAAKACATALSTNIYPLGTAGLEAAAKSSEPVFCASATIKPGALRVRCLGESSFVAILQTEEKDTPSLSYVYIRQDWTRLGMGSSEIRGPWYLTTRLGQRSTLSAVNQSTGQESGLQISSGTLRAWRKPEVDSKLVMVEFSGVACPQPTTLVTRLGRFKTSDLSANGSASGPRVQIEAHYPDIAGGLGGPATATSVSIPVMVDESELALDGADLSQLTFKSTAVLAVWRPRTMITAALRADQSYIWLGAVQVLNGKAVARLDLTRARLATYRSRDLLRVAFLFADLYLEVRSGSLAIVQASSTCRVLERKVPSSRPMENQDPQIIDARPTLVVEFPPQHIFEEALFKPAGTDLPEVVLPPTLTQFSVPLQEFSVDAQKAKGHDPLAFVYSTAPRRSAECARGPVRSPG